MEGLYKINLIPNDLSVEETVLQIADTLDNLNDIVNDIFTRITNKVKINIEKTTKLQERIDSSRRKVEKLAGTQNAIKVFSSAKYPASITHDHYKSIFDSTKYHYEPKKVSLSGKSSRQNNEKAIQEKLHFFHVKVAEPKTGKPQQDFDLKSVLNTITTVGDLLIYNSDESPYFGAKSKEQTYIPRVNTRVNKALDEAPPSIMKKNLLKREIDEYMYAPGMGMVPELDMPLDLPHLPGIAGDVQFSVTGEGSIAPSAVTSPVVPINPLIEAEVLELPDLGLPDIQVLPDLKQLPDLKDLNVKDLASDLPDAPPVPAVVSPAMPPPPPPPLPPPPPPMEMEISSPEHKREVQPKASSTPAPSSGDAHSSLMAAIRQAGGAGRAKLRSAVDIIPEKGGKSIGGDLMADLHAKLSMRRRGISGAEGTVLHTLARVIPEPGDDTPRSSSDDDWD